jgi:hypothetical protein
MKVDRETGTKLKGRKNMVEVEKEYASKGVAGAGLGLGIAGTALGLLQNGNLGGILGGWGNNWNANVCHENMPVNRYEAGLQATIASKDAMIALRDANTYNDQKLLEVYKYFDGQLRDVRDTLCAQAVHNQKTEDSFVLARQDIAAVESRLNSKIALEAERRCCADNAIVTYANATFYPKMVADVTVGTATTAQMLYNPIPDCGCGCGK